MYTIMYNLPRPYFEHLRAGRLHVRISQLSGDPTSFETLNPKLQTLNPKP